MYILTKLEYHVLKSIHDKLRSDGKDPVLNPVPIDTLESTLDTRQIKVAINAMTVFNFVSFFGEKVLLTPKGFEVFKDARLLDDGHISPPD